MSQFVSNKDVSQNAEIEGTKIVSDFGNQDVFADGYVALGLVPSSIGSVRLTNNTKVAFRSFDNLSNIEALFVDTSNKLVIGEGASNVDFKVGSGIAIPITPETVSTWAVVQDGYALIAAGGGTRAVWGPAGLDNGLVADGITELRALTDADATMVTLQGHAPGTRLGGGFFTWNPIPKADDGGLRFNAGGLGSNTAGWDRIILAESDLNVTWFGAQLDGVADDTGALASTIDAAILDGYRGVYIPQGTLRYTSTLAIADDNISIYGSNLTDENGLVAGTILQFDGVGPGILIGRDVGSALTSTYHTTLRGFTLKVPTTCSHAIRAWCPAYLRVDGVNVVGMVGNTRYGIMVEQGVDVEIRNCNVTGDNLTYASDRTTYANGIDIRHALGSPSTTTKIDKCYIHRCYESLTVYAAFAHATDTVMEGSWRGFISNGGRVSLTNCWIENCGVTGGVAAAGYLTTGSEAHLIACNIVGYADPQYMFNVVGTARLILDGGQISSDHGTPGLINPGDYTYGSGYVSVTDVDIASDISYGINYLASGGTQDRGRRFIGDNSPEGIVHANIGDLYSRKDGYAGFTLYVKESGTGTTGWRSLSTTTNTEVTEVRYLAATAGGDVATDGAVRLASGDSIQFRDSSNTVNVEGIGLDASDNLTIGDDLLPGNIIIGDPAMPGQVIINSGMSASTRIDGYDAFVATVETSTTWASALDGYVAVVSGSGSRVEWAAISASIITSGGANQVLWSNGTSNVWTGNPVVSSVQIESGSDVLLNTTGLTFANAKTILWKDTGGTAREIIRGDSSNIVDFGTLGGGYAFRNQSFAAKLLSLSETGTYLYFDKAVLTPVLYQETDTTNSITGDTFTIQAQNATGTTTTGGSLKLQSGTGTTVPGSIQLWVGASQSAQFGRNASDFLAFGDEPADTGTIRFSHGNNIVGEASTPGTDIPLLEWGVYVSGRLSVGHSSLGVLHLRAGTTSILNGSNANIWSASTDINIYVPNEQWSEGVASPQILQLQRGSDAAVQNFTITPQAPYGTASVNTKGGDLVVALASPVGGGTAEASLKITRGGAFYAAIGKGDAAAYTRLWMGPSLTPSASNYAIQSNGSSTFINGISEINFAINGINYAIFTGALLEWGQGVTAPKISQATRTSGAPQNMLIAPQPPDVAASGANRRPGSLVVSLAAPTNGGTDEAALVVNRDGYHYVSIGPRVSDSGRSAVYLTPGVTPTALNYTIAADASSTILNSNGSAFLIAFSGVSKLTLGTYYLQWAYDVASPIFNQGTDSTNGITGDTFTIQAQNATGTTTTGGALKLQAGSGTSVNGAIQLFSGSTQVGQFGAASGDYLAFGADPADSGTIRFSAGATIKGEANPTGTDATILTYTDQTALEVGSSGITTTTISGATVEINGASATLIEAVEIAAGRRVVSLVLGADLTTTEMPANTGDRVVYVSNAATNPTANPVGGFILYANNGQPTFRTSDGYTLTVGSVDVGGANEVYWSNGSSNSWTGAPTVTSLNASSYVSIGSTVAATGAIRLAHGSEIKSRNNANSADRTVIGFGTTTADWITIGDTGGTGTYIRTPNVQFNQGSTVWTLDANRFRFYGIFELTWDLAATNPLIKQDTDTTNGITGDTFTIQAQNATGTTTTGGTLKLQSGTGTTNNGTVQLFSGTYSVGHFGILPGNPGYTGAWIGPPITPSTTNYTLLADGSSVVILNSPGSIAFYTSSATPQMILSSNLLQWYSSVTSPAISHAALGSDLTPTSFTIQGQYPFATATGANRIPGSVIINVGSPTNSGTTEAGFKVTRSGTLHCQIGAYNTPPSYSAVWLGPGITPSTTNFAFLGDGTGLAYLNAPSGGTVYLSLAGSGAYGISVTSTVLQFTSTETVQWPKGVTAPLLKQVAKDANETPRSITITPQAPWDNVGCTGTNRYPGHLIVALTAPVQSATTEASLKITRGGTFAAALGPLTDGYGASYSALWCVPGTSPTWQNWQIAASSTLLGINAYSTTGSIQFQAGGNYITNLSYTGNLSWYHDVIPILSQDTQSGDYATNSFEIRAQGAYASASTYKNGGDLILKSGAEASGGLGGSLKLYIGAQGMMELREVASGRNIIALCTTGVTATEMPADTGNMVIYIANCSTVPTGNPTSGGILYVDDGNLYWRDPSGVSTQLN